MAKTKADEIDELFIAGIKEIQEKAKLWDASMHRSAREFVSDHKCQKKLVEAREYFGRASAAHKLKDEAVTVLNRLRGAIAGKMR